MATSSTVAYFQTKSCKIVSHMGKEVKSIADISGN